MTNTGIYLPLFEDGSHLRTAAAMEQLGYRSLWIAGGQLDRLDRVDELIDATDRAQVATGIVPLGVYPVDAIAALHARLATSRPGRFVLGLGGPQEPKPLQALRGYLDELDAAGVGAADRLLAALGPRKIEVARDRSAGAITLLVTPESTAATRARLGAHPRLVVHQLVVLDSDGERARDACRATVGFLAGVDGYRKNFTRMGFADAEVAGLSDRFLNGVIAWGDEAAIVERVEAHRAAGADEVVVSITGVDGGPGVLDVARRLAEPLGL